MRYLVSGLGVVAAFSLMLAAGWMNWRFMTSLATDETDRLALGLASIGIDLLKAALAYLIALGWDRRQWGYVGVASITYALLAAVSLASSFGFAAESRDAMVSQRNLVSTRYQSAATALAEVEAKLTSRGPARASAVIESEIAGLQREPRWLATKGCTVMRGQESRAICRAFSERTTELAAARMIEALELRRDGLRKAILELTEIGALRPADRQTQYAEMIGLRPQQLGIALLLLLASVLELSAGLGLYLALRPLTASARQASERGHLQKVASLKVDEAGQSNNETAGEELVSGELKKHGHANGRASAESRRGARGETHTGRSGKRTRLS